MTRIALATLVWLLVPTFAIAQAGAAAGLLDRLQGNGVLLQFLMMEQPSVQQELRATPEQVAAVRALGERQRAKLDGLSQRPQAEVAKTLLEIRETSEAELKKILTPEQQQRLWQIALQQAGPLIGLTQPHVSSTLVLTADQQARLRQLRESLIAEVTSHVPQEGARPRELLSGLAQIQTAKRNADNQALALLTPMQQTQWQQLQGAPFQGAIGLTPGGGNFRPGARLRGR
jgi:Spy/CpxP family protein refolding chaperone